MTQKKSAFNFDKTIFGFNITERGIKSFSKTFKVGPFSQTLNIKLDSGKVRGTTSLPGTGLAKRYDLPSLEDFQVPDLPEHKEDMWHDGD